MDQASVSRDPDLGATLCLLALPLSVATSFLLLNAVGIHGDAFSLALFQQAVLRDVVSCFFSSPWSGEVGAAICKIAGKGP